MTRSLSTALLLLTLGCREHHDSRSGTSVGNPGKGTARIASASGLSIDSAQASGASIVAKSCHEVPTVATLIYADALDLLSPESFDVPEGTWCALELDLETLTLFGTGDSGGTLELNLGLAPFSLYTKGLDVDASTSWVIELGSPGWLDATEIGLLDDVFIGGDDVLHDLLEEKIYIASALYLDDGDGTVDEDEREKPVGDAKDKQVDEDKWGDGDASGAPGCRTTGGTRSLWLSLLSLFLIFSGRERASRRSP
jgi:hypothetical protein